MRSARRLFGGGGSSGGGGSGGSGQELGKSVGSSSSLPSSRDHTPEYASIVELKASGPASNTTTDANASGVGVTSYLKMFESFLQDRKKQAATVASLANSSLSLNSGKFLFSGGGRRGRSADMIVKSCETQTVMAAARGVGSSKSGKDKSKCELTASRMLNSTSSKLTPAVLNTSGLLSVNINMDDENDDDDDETNISCRLGDDVLMPPPLSSSSPSSSSSSSSASPTSAGVPSVSSSSNCGGNGDGERSIESAQFTANEIEEPKVLRRQHKYLVELR